jgi:hypothetical protein
MAKPDREEMGYPKQRSDGQGPHPQVEKLFVTKGEFYEAMGKVRDRQDAQTLTIVQKQTRVEEKILAELRRSNDASEAHCDKQVAVLKDSLAETKQDVKDLEKHARQETVVGSLIAGVSASVVAFITVRFGGG